MAQLKGYGKIVLYSGTGCPDLAEEISAELGVPLGGRDDRKFANDNTFVRLHQSVRGQDAFVIQTTSAPVNDNVMELLIFLDTLKRASAGRVTAVIPYLAYGRSDKKDQPRVPITARLVADMIQIAGADRYITLDLHAGQIQGFFSIPGDTLTAFPLLADYMRQKDLRNAVVVSADLGFAKKARVFAEELDLPVAFVEKRRVEDHTAVLTVIGDVAGKDVIIVDDEVDTGGTMCDDIQVMKEAGAHDVYCCFVHAIFSGHAVDLLAAQPIKEMVTTNSVPLRPGTREALPNLTVLSVAPLLAGVITRVHSGHSVGKLFKPYHGYS
ncbi:MAG TPA: ribose-phosphate pyrophosphokinase [Anaerolineae bacterium]|nr:ribose-phosphate pyrophosphokinase [Anaerolineae bacterium]HQI87086.1 ribose-phosphate pyrophosphokinase [Anaerolineae bacterium]